MLSSKMINDELYLPTLEPGSLPNRSPRRSLVSLASEKRPSINIGSANSNKANQGVFRRAVPQMPRVLACICFVLNLVLPGTGMNSV